jgi:hypothetical protein
MEIWYRKMFLGEIWVIGGRLSYKRANSRGICLSKYGG